MWFRGSKNGVSIWYAVWGAKGGDQNVEMYRTLNGLAKWMINNEVPVHRIGRMVITEEGPVEKEHWDSREEFLKWAKPLIGLKS